jgi:hypothetical protein
MKSLKKRQKKDAQTWVGTQMVAANDIQNKILKGLKEVSGTLQNGIQVQIYSELNKCYNYSLRLSIGIAASNMPFSVPKLHKKPMSKV